ncbi:MAG: TIGR00299 family protein [Desulfobacterales bacterium C00003060]|nr:MAG: TIGR00299 family protein [Desulfobacterales bacterium S3730MH5]OEU80947.1 MAG: TIGR00299 family protein [Desulfobacterales bacterium S5133MH4]OEU81789.1 MAG: TIGR00299 family protein [Desulfobacterales bacterium C00003060]
MNIAYFDCFSGISGDMILGALMHLGVPVDFVEDNIRKMPLKAFRLEITTAARMGIHGRKVRVVLDDGDKHARNYKDIRSLINDSPLPDTVKRLSLDIFGRLAEIEASIHNCSKDDVHFHELGGVDAIVDIVGAALGVRWLGIGKVFASEIPVGKGFVICHHGRLPVPAPATLALLDGVPVYGTTVSQELVTPTGAAILTSLCRDFGPMPRMLIQEIGYGVGTRDLKEMPNLLRVVVGESDSLLETDCVTVVETNIDDMNPEIFGFVMERLFEDGALDVIWIPVFMKKNRPGTVVQVMCKETDRGAVVHRILSETTATGVRYYRAGRAKLPRKVKEAATSYGKVRVKEVSGPTGRVSVVPEYEDCKRIALEKNVPLKVVYQTIMKETA